MIVLSEAQSKVGIIVPEADGLREQLGLLRDKSESAYTTDNIEEICAVIDKLDEDIKPALSSLLVCIHAKRNEVVQLIASLSEEDRAFHEAQCKEENQCQSFS